MVLLPTGPAYPVGFVPSVKSISRTDPVLKVSAPVPAEILNDMLLASVTMPGVIIRAADVLALTITNGVPLTVVVVLPVNTVPAMVNVEVSVPVEPKTRVFAPVPIKKTTADKFLLAKSKVPAVSMKVPLLKGRAIGLKSTSVFTAKVSPQPGESTKSWLKRIISPAEFRVWMAPCPQNVHVGDPVTVVIVMAVVSVTSP